MSIQVRCPYCKNDQSIKNKVCLKCGKALPKKNRTYRVIVKYDGTTVTKSIPNDLELARSIEVKIKSELIDGKYYNRRKNSKQNIKYGEFIKKKYLPYAQSKKSYQREEELLRIWILPIIENKLIKQISPFDVEKIKKHIIDSDLSPRTAEYALSIVRHTLNKAIDWGILSGINPVTKVKMPKVNNKRIRFLSVDEANNLLNEIKKHSNQIYEISLLSLHTGMRAGELFGLQYKNLDFNNRIIHINNTKNGEDRIAYMDKEVYDMLSSKDGNPEDYVFKSIRNKKINSISKTFAKAVRKLGLNDGITSPKEKVVFHTLRHTFASWLAINGISIYTIKELMGHKALSMTERYSHLSQNSKITAAKSIENMLSSPKEKGIIDVVVSR